MGGRMAPSMNAQRDSMKSQREAKGNKSDMSMGNKNENTIN
jgi:hypothetical protein